MPYTGLTSLYLFYFSRLWRNSLLSWIIIFIIQMTQTFDTKINNGIFKTAIKTIPITFFIVILIITKSIMYKPTHAICKKPNNYFENIYWFKAVSPDKIKLPISGVSLNYSIFLTWTITIIIGTNICSCFIITKPIPNDWFISITN